jgi:hypothetical protein
VLNREPLKMKAKSSGEPRLRAVKKMTTRCDQQPESDPAIFGYGVDVAADILLQNLINDENATETVGLAEKG